MFRKKRGGKSVFLVVFMLLLIIMLFLIIFEKIYDENNDMKDWFV